MSITTDLMDFPQKSSRSFFIEEVFRGVSILRHSKNDGVHLGNELDFWNVICSRLPNLFTVILGVGGYLYP